MCRNILGILQEEIVEILKSSPGKEVLLVPLEKEDWKLGGLTTFVHLKDIAYITTIALDMEAWGSSFLGPPRADVHPNGLKRDICRASQGDETTNASTVHRNLSQKLKLHKFTIKLMNGAEYHLLNNALCSKFRD